MGVVCVIFSIVCPFISIPLLLYAMYKDKNHTLLYCILLAIPLAIIIYNFVPDKSKDLFRYYVEMEYDYSKMSLIGYLKVMFSNTKVLFNTMQYLISKTGNYNLLPFIITLIGYTITFYIIFDYSKYKKIKYRYSLLILIVFMCTFHHLSFMSGLAQYLAISISFLAFYIEYVKQKHFVLCRILYVLSIFIHISTFILLLFRLLLIFDYKKSKLYYIILLCGYAIIPPFLNLFINDSNISKYPLIIKKIYFYMISGDRRLQSTYEFAILAYLIFILFMHYFFKGLIRKSFQKRISKRLPAKYYNFMEIVLLFNIFSLPYSDIFIRFFNLSLLCFILYFIEYIGSSRINHRLIPLIVLLPFMVMLASVNINSISSMDSNLHPKDVAENIVWLLDETFSFK